MAVRQEFVRWIWGVSGLVLLPALVLLDTLRAVRGGWRHPSGDAVETLVRAAWVYICLVLVLSLLPGIARRFRAWAPQLGLLGFSFTVGVVLAELMLAWLLPHASFHRRPPNQTFVLDPDPVSLGGTSGRAVYRTNSLGLRGSEIPPDSLRILCVGGGTTECLYLDDRETWPALLAEKLTDAESRPVWVGAASIAEFASGHHLRFLRGGEFPEPIDCLVVMVGANDLMRLLLELDFGAVPPPFWYESRIMGLARAIWNVRLGHGIRFDPTGAELRKYRLGPGMESDSTSQPVDLRSRAFRPRSLDLDDPLAEYAARLTDLCAAAKERGVRLVLVTQPVLWEDFLDAHGKRKLLLAREIPYPRLWDFLTAPKLAAAMRRYNDVLAAVARDNHVEWIDAALEMNGHQEFFQDDFHLNEEGCAALADIIARYLATRGLGSPVPSGSDASP